MNQWPSKIYLTLAIGFFLWLGLTHQASAAVLSAKVSASEVAVGESFTVNITVDTQGQSINTLEVGLSFPPDKLQLVSPTSGNSIIEIYSTPPRYNNQSGKIDLAGGIPGGLSTNNGLVATLTFRAKSNGTATIRFQDNTRVLLHDGQGTDVLNQTNSGTVILKLPAPIGPIVTSTSHPDQELWYRESNINLAWKNIFPVEGYSYVLSSEFDSIVDDIVDTASDHITYKSQPDGIHYFHIKALRDGVWGGVTRFAVRIDSSPPAKFPIEITPSFRTTTKQPYLSFATTDALSGFDHFALKLVPLKAGSTPESELLFFDVSSPFVTSPLEKGRYNVVVRAYDKAGNSLDVVQELVITNFLGQFVFFSGLVLLGKTTIPWYWVMGILLAMCLGIIFGIRRLHRKGRNLHTEQPTSLPDHVKRKLDELSKYQQKYGKLAVTLLLAILLPQLILVNQTKAQETQSAELGSPSITTYPKDITDEEIFYLGGRTQDSNTTVIIHVQQENNGQTFDYTTESDKLGDWFYRHTSTLLPGNYIIWVQAKIGARLSAPSSKVELNVQPVAFKFGGSKVTYESAYQIALAMAIIFLIILVGVFVFVWRTSKSRIRAFKAHIAKTQDHLRIGFENLRRDMEAELAMLRRLQLSAELSVEEKVREEQIKLDLTQIHQYLSEESEEINTFAKN